eukprot:m.759202 g.759202  ORF g.759202 m.759202 type:complete len:248 (+) comp23194_c0_seq30:95-838(+)
MKFCTSSLMTVAVVFAGMQHVNSFEHGYDTVGDTLWGWIGAPFTAEVTEFYAKTYQVICIASGSPINGTDPAAVAQWDLFEQARTLRKLNPKVKLLLYENADFGVIGVGTDQIQQHPEWWLRDDNGNPYMDPKRVRCHRRGPHIVPYFVPYFVPCCIPCCIPCRISLPNHACVVHRTHPRTTPHTASFSVHLPPFFSCILMFLELLLCGLNIAILLFVACSRGRDPLCVPCFGCGVVIATAGHAHVL